MTTVMPNTTPISGPGPDPLDRAADPRDLARPFYGASFPVAVKRYFKNYVKFSGRASRSEYWWAYLFNAICEIIAGSVAAVGVVLSMSWTRARPIHTTVGYDEASGQPIVYDTYPGLIKAPMAWLMVVGFVLVVVVGLGLLLPTLAITWRRLHDANLSGLFWLLNLVPSLGGIAVLVLTLLGSNPAGRRFDRQPGNVPAPTTPPVGWGSAS